MISSQESPFPGLSNECPISYHLLRLGGPPPSLFAGLDSLSTLIPTPFFLLLLLLIATTTATKTPITTITTTMLHNTASLPQANYSSSIENKFANFGILLT